MIVYEELLASLTSIRDFLLKFNEQRWSSQIEQTIKDSTSNESEMLQKVESFFGGMGSINDLMIAKVNGHFIEPHEEQEVNKELQVLCDNMSTLIEKVQRRSNK